MPSELPRLETIFNDAMEIAAPQERSAFLDRACGDDAELRRRVEALLAAHDGTEDVLRLPYSDRTLELPLVSEGPGTTIGRYKLLEQIGEGGFGVVFMAEQQQPVRRRVALKVIKLGMDTKEVIARFEAERQALALIDHPNIARVLDAGATDTGRPYFVMELVRGVSITEYCDSNNLSTRQRLELFVPVCRAVQHAHQKGIIHRDIKPSNVLITMHDGVPVPKVIDFGIAKATSGRLTDKTLFTQYHQFVGTPQYMSPEQAEMSGLDIDTRADVYALGVLVYELLTGSTPFDAKTLREAAYAEIQRIIREVEPPKPSTRVSTLGETLTAVAAHRGIDPRKLSALMRGDLDWIVMKCLEKDRTRRYETTNELRVEIERHLNNDTVLARPTSAAYRVRKFVRRHKLGVAAAAAIAVTLLLGIIGTTYGLLRAKDETANAKKETERATQEADKARAVTDFVEEMLASANPLTNSRNDITVRQIVDEAARKLDSGSFKDQPPVEAEVRRTLGVTYRGLGKKDQAELQLRKSLALVEKVYGPESAQAGSTLMALGNACMALQRPEAIDLLQRSLKTQQKCFGSNSIEVARVLSSLGNAVSALERDNVAAEVYAREGLRICRENHNDKLGATVLTLLAGILMNERQYAESLVMHREALDINRKYEGEDSYNVLVNWYSLSITLRHTGDLQACDEALT